MPLWKLSPFIPHSDESRWMICMKDFKQTSVIGYEMKHEKKRKKRARRLFTADLFTIEPPSPPKKLHLSWAGGGFFGLFSRAEVAIERCVIPPHLRASL